MKAKISALMDGELGRHEAPEAFAALQSEQDALQTWRTYHLISDALRETRLLSEDFAQRVAQRLAEEPTVVAAVRLARETRPSGARWIALSAAAGIAAVALVGWLAFAPLPGGAPPPQLAQPAAPAVPPPEAADDYLLAHQSYSPRNALQGVVPYVRVVAGGAEAKTP